MDSAAAPTAASAAASAADAGRSRRALLVALGVDNAGSGLFLPLTVVYATRVVGVPLGLVGALVTAGTLVGLLAPPVAGRLVDRVGPRAVVVASQLLQAAGLAVYLAATGPATVLVAAALVAAGTQTFYSALFALIADVAPPGPKDHTFAVVDRVRSAAFGVGALVAALLLTATPDALQVALVVDAASFVSEGGVLARRGPPPRTGGRDQGQADPLPRGDADPAAAAPAHGPVWKDRPYVGLIATTVLLGLPSDVFLIGMPVYAGRLDGAATWVGSLSLALLTVAISALNTTVVRRTRRWSRTAAMSRGGWCLVAWAAAAAAAIWLPRAWTTPWLLGSTLVLAAGSLLFGTRVNALAEAAAPPPVRGRYLAAFQYAFTAAGLLAPLLVSALAVAAWLPWLLVGLAAAAGALALGPLSRRLPAAAVHPHVARALSEPSGRAAG